MPLERSYRENLDIEGIMTYMFKSYLTIQNCDKMFFKTNFNKKFSRRNCQVRVGQPTNSERVNE